MLDILDLKKKYISLSYFYHGIKETLRSKKLQESAKVNGKSAIRSFLCPRLFALFFKHTNTFTSFDRNNIQNAKLTDLIITLLLLHSGGGKTDLSEVGGRDFHLVSGHLQENDRVFHRVHQVVRWGEQLIDVLSILTGNGFPQTLQVLHLQIGDIRLLSRKQTMHKLANFSGDKKKMKVFEAYSKNSRFFNLEIF